MKLAILLLLAALAAGFAQGQTLVRIGELNSYQRMPAFLAPYRRGLELGVEEHNRGAGRQGYRLQLVIRDDDADPTVAVRIAQELVARERVAFLMGAFRSDVALAVSAYAKKNHVLFLATGPLSERILWGYGHRYVFRLRPSTHMQIAMLVPHAARERRKRWALVYPNTEYGQSAAASFRHLLARAQPDVQFVAVDAAPDAIFSALFAEDLQKFVREGDVRGLFAGRTVVNLLAGHPEHLEMLEPRAVDGWYVTGYPPEAVRTPEHMAFRMAYEARYKEPPKAGALAGYVAIQTVAALLQAARSLETERLVDAFEGLRVKSAVGPVFFRASDHQSTMGAYVGRLRVRDGRATMSGWYYADGAAYLPKEPPR